MPGHYQGPPPPMQNYKPDYKPAPPKPRIKDPDFWESGQGDGSAGTYKKKTVPGGGGKKSTYTPEKD